MTAVELFLLVRCAGWVSDLCVENGERLCCVQRDEDSNQELLVFRLQGQSKSIDDAGEGKIYNKQDKNTNVKKIQEHNKNSFSSKITN